MTVPMTPTRPPWLALVLLLLTGLPVHGAAQTVQEVPLTLAEAEAEALTRNPEVRAVRSEATAAEHARDAAGAFRWPGIEADAGVMGTDDPVAAFGTKLRQERFGAADLDVPLLNDPGAAQDWTAGLGARWNVADPALWAELRAADADARAAGAVAVRSAQAVRYQARVFYLDLIRAGEQNIAAEAAEGAAEATAARVQSRRDEGMATDADLLQARAALSDATARRLRTAALAADAADRLAVHLAWAPDRVPVPTTTLAAIEAEGWWPSAQQAAGGESVLRAGARPDLVASEAAVAAAQARAGRATAARLPRVSGFARLSTHAEALGDDRASHWTAGVEVRVPVFTGFGLRGAREAGAASARASEVRHEDRVRQAHAQVVRARRAVDTARQSREAAATADEAAQEAVRLLRRRYEEGMTTLAELLQAEAQAARLRAAAVEAHAQVGLAQAALAFALGEDDDDPSDGDVR
jgi:outer membrane protein TolC